MRNYPEIFAIKARSFYLRKTSRLRAQKIKNKDFTIISNNCWGGFIYQSYGLKYNTPTIGLFFMAEDYIKFIYNLKHYLNIEKITEIKIRDSKYKKYLQSIRYHGLIGKLDDIEIMFMHYKSFKDATTKWNKRKRRVRVDNILFKFSEQNECTEKEITEFQRFPANNKICFISNSSKTLANDHTFVVGNVVKTTNEPFGASKTININKLINNLKKNG